MTRRSSAVSKEEAARLREGNPESRVMHSHPAAQQSHDRRLINRSLQEAIPAAVRGHAAAAHLYGRPADLRFAENLCARAFRWRAVRDTIRAVRYVSGKPHCLAMVISEDGSVEWLSGGVDLADRGAGNEAARNRFLSGGRNCHSAHAPPIAAE